MMDASDIYSSFFPQSFDSEPKAMDLLLSSFGHQMQTSCSGNHFSGLECVFGILDEAEKIVSKTNVSSMEPTPIGPQGARPAMDGRPPMPETLSIDEDQRHLLGYVLKPLIDQLPPDSTGYQCIESTTSREDVATPVMVSSIGPSKVEATTEAPSIETSGDEDRFRPYQFGQWKDRFQELIAFQKKNGHCLVPHNFRENLLLSKWVKRQRYQYKLKKMNRHSTLTDEREAALQKLGFVWDSHSSAWIERFDALKEFHALYGHCSVPSNYIDKSLAIWVKCQRRQHKMYRKGAKSTLTPKRLRLLEELNFEWNPRNL